MDGVSCLLESDFMTHDNVVEISEQVLIGGMPFTDQLESA